MVPGRNALLASAALSCFVYSPVCAQDEATPGNEPVAENTEAGANDRIIIVTSERRATNLQDTPLSVVAVTDEIAEARASRTSRTSPSSLPT